MVETCVQLKVQPSQETPSPAPRAKGRIIFDPAWCRTCKVCEVACSINKEGQARPAVARIHIMYDEFKTINPISGALCAQCADAPCIAACRVEAMTRDKRTGAVLILEEKCVGCMRCAKACPWQIPQKHPDRRKAIKCDLCFDRPEGPLCVEMCPLSGKALRYEPDYYGRGEGDGRG